MQYKCYEICLYLIVTRLFLLLKKVLEIDINTEMKNM